MAIGNVLRHQPVGHIWAEALHGPEGQPALEYLMGPSRGLTLETIREAGLGYVTTELPGWERFQGAISIPYHDGRGREVGVRFRWNTGDRKYDQRTGTPNRLYGIHLIEEAVVYLTEGEFDSLILRQAGMAAISIPGTQGWADHWRWLFRDCRQVFVVFDSDESGRDGARTVQRSLRDVGPRVGRVELPVSKDLTDVFVEGGAEALRRALT